MPLYKLDGKTPVIASTAYISPNAVVIGDVALGEYASVWFGAVLRGDNEPISIGANSNVQDLAVLHTDPGFPLLVGANVTVGHQVALHGCVIGEGSLIGIQAVVLNGAVIGKRCLIGAGAVVTERKVFPDGCLIIGAPAKLVRELNSQELASLDESAARYVRRQIHYRDNLTAIADGSL